jgi:dihydrofolate synthase / folylpolyglutamate synthase
VNYRDALAWLYGTQTFGIKLGLENARSLLAAAGHPHERLKFLHVAGTNGKGSTCAMMDAVLRSAGHRTGLYTSPHLMDFRERIRLNGQLIPEAAVAEGLGLLRAASESWEHAPTFFELATALAAWWFASQEAEFVVWETGMGGRLDATNAVTPLVSVITPVGLDHQEWLGETVELIAAEKAGIIKPGIPVVSAPQFGEVRAVLEAKALAGGSRIEFVSVPWRDGPVGLAGVHQSWNAALALAALRAAGVEVGAETARAGLGAVKWPARFQRFGADLVVDGAHNPEAAATLAATWREVFGGVKARLVLGALRDKDVSGVLRVLREIADEVWLVPVAGARGAPVDDLRPAAVAAGFTAVHASTVEEVLAEARPGGAPVLVTGSLFLAGEVLALLEGAEKPVASTQ